MINISTIRSALHSLSVKNQFTSQLAMLFTASILGNISSYAYLLFTGRALGVQSFGSFGSLFGIFYICCLLADAMRIAVANNVASIKVQVGDSAAVKHIRRPLLKLSLIVLAISLILAVNSWNISNFFHIDSPNPVYILSAALVATFILAMILGTLQGLQWFRHLAVIGYLLPQILKLLFGITFVLIGWGLSGSIGALLASTTIAAMAGSIPLLRLTATSRKIPNYSSSPISHVAMPILLVGIIISVPTSVDVMLVTHFFRPEEAGLYNAAVTMGKIVLFLPIAVSLVTLPKASERHALGLGTSRLMKHSLTYIIALLGIVLILYWLLPRQLIYLLFGEEYWEAALIIGWYGTTMAIFALNYLFAQYHLATSNRIGLLIGVGLTLAEVASIFLFHSSLFQVIMVLLVGNISLVIYNFLALAKQ